MRKFAISLTGAAFALAALSTSASATALSYGGQNNGRANVMTTNSTALPNVNASAGPFTMNNTTAGGSFLAWCLDLYSYLASGDYTELTGPFTGPNTGGNPNPFANSNDPSLTNLQLDKIEDLFEVNGTAVETIYSTGNDSSNNIQAAGFQLALWELIYETGPAYSLTGGTFQASPASAQKTSINSAANAFLGKLGGKVEFEYNLTFWENVTGTNQNLVSLSAPGTPVPSPVPLPAAGFLMIAGLAGLGAVARRRKT